MTRTIAVLAIAFGVSLGSAYPSAALAEAPCPNEEIRVEQESTRLPECMAYELVSPVDTIGTGVGSPIGSPDGNHAWFLAILPISAGQSSGNIVTYAARRTSSGWQSRDQGFVPGNNNQVVLQAYSADGSRALVQTCENILIGCIAGRVGFERVEESGARTQMLEVTIGNHFPEVGRVVGHSDDLSRVFLTKFPEDNVAPFLAEDTHTAGEGLYESHDGTLAYLGRDENDSVLPCGVVLANDTGGAGGSGFEQSGVSADGRTVAFESPDPKVTNIAGCKEPVDVYVRRDGVSVNISRPRNGNLDEGARFAGASRDGEMTYFSTTSRLVAGDIDSEPDIYSYDLATDTQDLITAGVGVEGSDHPTASVSPSGDYIYFASENPYNGQGVAGRPNLYAYHDGDIRFIATATSGHFGLGGGIRSNQPGLITPDGTHLLFNSSDPFGSGQPTGGQEQIFQYSYDEDTMTCISCPPDGSAPTTLVTIIAAGPGGTFDQRTQSDDGNSVPFETPAALLPEDVNKASDVYLWRRNEPLALISGGRNEAGAHFGTISADGRSVFFEASDRLIPSANQDDTKIYAARVNGGFAPPPTPTPCTGEACRGAGPPAPGTSPTASNTFSGPGNPAPKRAAKKPRKKKVKAHKKQHKRAAKHNRGAVR